MKHDLNTTFEETMNPILNPGYHTKSKKYRFVNTMQLKQLIETNYPTLTLDKTSVDRVRKKELEGTQRHLLVYNITTLDNGDKPQLIIHNSHNGKQATTVRLGFFRSVCANGLIAGRTIFLKKIKHLGQDTDKQIIAAIHSAIEHADKLINSIELMKNKQINNAELQRLCNVVLLNRISPDTDEKRVETTKQLLFTEASTAQREEDMSNDLWTSMNRVQEIGIRGRSGLFRQLTSSSSIVELNEQLFETALSMVA